MEGCKRSERGLEPNSSSARSQPRIVPGTPPDPEAARHALVERNGLPVLIQEAGLLESRGRRLAAVYGRDAPVAGPVDDHKAAAPDATGVRLGDAEGRGRRHGGVHSVAAVS
jgi:hypothetical protein